MPTSAHPTIKNRPDFISREMIPSRIKKIYLRIFHLIKSQRPLIFIFRHDFLSLFECL